MTEMGWQLVRTPDGSPVSDCNAFMFATFDVIASVKNTMMSEARSKK